MKYLAQNRSVMNCRYDCGNGWLVFVHLPWNSGFQPANVSHFFDMSPVESQLVVFLKRGEIGCYYLYDDGSDHTNKMGDFPFGPTMKKPYWIHMTYFCDFPICVLSKTLGLNAKSRNQAFGICKKASLERHGIEISSQLQYGVIKELEGTWSGADSCITTTVTRTMQCY